MTRKQLEERRKNEAKRVYHDFCELLNKLKIEEPKSVYITNIVVLNYHYKKQIMSIMFLDKGLSYTITEGITDKGSGSFNLSEHSFNMVACAIKGFLKGKIVC